MKKKIAVLIITFGVLATPIFAIEPSKVDKKEPSVVEEQKQVKKEVIGLVYIKTQNPA